MRRQRGSSLVMTMALLAGLVAIVASVAATQHQNMVAQANRQQRQRARGVAMSGVQRAYAAFALITQSTTTGASSSSSTVNSPGATTLQDDWALLGDKGNVKFVVGSDAFRIEVIDASSRLNVNTATEDQLNKLPLTPEEVAALIDFRSASRDASALGAKDEYYNALTEPYNAKLGNLDTVDELLQVKGFTAKHLYEPRTDIQSSNAAPTDAAGVELPLAEILTAVSYAPMTNPQGEAKINVNQPNNAQRIAPLGLSPAVLIQLVPPQGQPPRTFANIGAVCAIATSPNDLQIILDNLTTDNSTRRLGRININTASQSVLETIPGITSDIASSIVSHQTQGFASLGEITQIPGISNTVLSQAADLLTAASQTFIVRVMGVVGTNKVALEALVDVENGTPKLLYIQEPPYNDVISKWGWQDQTTSDTILKEAS